mmetsp:Transcript_13592/g.54469  ORF Transcript_13592/g.54469 Transcript_13592/m.54469 type:complete len:309 (-) Transcript_13592:1606-2532(-)|eukprot:CAMPEP_0113959112 /NCGR_PEP_ID=MMETSP0011_2-20120614/3956_1 /TAXON_ID=101924 /ORGANISM="Rhodosorus marinus" /LENGTH=308 /DNA_ID=CAMNT_0000970373 /DNA_START=460 /DNA_END=1386 /DNA_ORIENTATION=+ /assembly_acc=CAM_ASM_000156
MAFVSSFGAVSRVGVGRVVSLFDGGAEVRANVRRSRRVVVELGAAPPPPPESEPEPEVAEEVKEEVDDEFESEDAEAQELDGQEEFEEVNDVLNSPAMLKKRIEILQSELDESQAEREMLAREVESEKDSFIRLSADFENFRRRSSAEILESTEKASVKITREFLTVLDSFERAAGSVSPETEREEKINNAYQSINKQFVNTLEKLSIEPIEALGTPFNAEIHSAIQQQESAEYDDGIVMMQFQRGYKVGQRLIRPAMVMVSMGAAAEDSTEPAETGAPAEESDAVGAAEESDKVQEPEEADAGQARR